MKFNFPEERCLKLADLEGTDEVSAGTLPAFVTQVPNVEKEAPELAIARGIAFGRFVEMKRRELQLTLEQLCDRAELDTSELISIEQDARYQPEPSAVIQLAKIFNLPPKGLMQLAGLAKPRNSHFYAETMKFAARSESTHQLSDEERELLEHFAAILANEK